MGPATTSHQTTHHAAHRAPITPGSQRHPTLHYDPALDGLRAVAVLAVLLYHAGVPWAQGGFLGVDLFFVLSGYLITTLLLLEHRRWGSVDMAAFWGRRARRLLPALFAMLLAVAAFAVVVALPQQQGSIAAQGVATEFYVGNWWQILNDQSYFAQFVDPSPLQHTWSLAIEEQFYLLFPALLGAVLLLRGTRRGLPTLLGVAALASAAWMAFLYQPGTDPSRVYFGTDTRIQELLVGAVLAAALAVAGDRGLGVDRILPRRARRIIAPLALLGILALMATTSDQAEWLYRGGFLAFCVLAAVLLLALAHRDDAPLRRLVSWRPLVLVGIISYGLYLWHWPVFVWLDERRTGLDGWSLVALRFGVSFAVAIASYWLIERPVRYGHVRRRWGVRGEAYAFAVAGGSALLALALVAATAPAGLAADGSGGPSGTSGAGTPNGGGVSAFLVGDSVAYSLRSQDDPTQHPGLIVDGSTHLGCGVLPVSNVVDGKLDPPGEGCQEWADAWPSQIVAAGPDLGVLFLGHWQQFDVSEEGVEIPFGTPQYEAYLDRWITRFVSNMRQATGRVALVNVPCHRVVEDGRNPIPTITNDESRVLWLNGAIDRIAARLDVPVIDFHGWLCGPGADPEYRNGVKLRFDGLHFTKEGASLVWAWLGNQLLEVARAGAGPAARPSASASTASSASASSASS